MPVRSKRLSLTEEELWLLQQMRSGRKFTEIAKAEAKPAIKYRMIARKIYDKLGADNRTQAVMIAIELRILNQAEFYGS